MQAVASDDPAQNIELIELTMMLLVHTDFLHHIAPEQKGVPHAQARTDVQLGRQKGRCPPNPSLSPPCKCIANHTACLILLSHQPALLHAALALNPASLP